MLCGCACKCGTKLLTQSSITIGYCVSCRLGHCKGTGLLFKVTGEHDEKESTSTTP